MEEYKHEMSSCTDYSNYQQIKPVLKKNLLHNSNNAIVMWKSFEIWMIEETTNANFGKTRVHNPIYVPITYV